MNAKKPTQDAGGVAYLGIENENFCRIILGNGRCLGADWPDCFSDGVNHGGTKYHAQTRSTHHHRR